MNELDTNEVIQLGMYAEELLTSQNYHKLVALFRLDAMDHLLSTKPLEQERRELIYNSVQAMAEFTGMLHVLHQAKDKALAEGKQATFPVHEDDAPPANEELTDEQIFSLVDAPYTPPQELSETD